MQIQYLSGFGNYFSSEAEPGTLPIGQNSPQKVAHGLFAEQLSGSAFTAPRKNNLRSWLYRIRPSVMHGEFKPFAHTLLCSNFHNIPASPNQLRWDPLALPTKPTDFVDGLISFAGNEKSAAIHIYACNRSMEKRFFYNADGDFLFVPQLGEIRLKTEFGILQIKPGEIAVVQRGIKYQVILCDKEARGYICENYGAPFTLPELGLIGANGLANPRDFQTPCAAYENKTGQWQLLAKFDGTLWEAALNHSPLDVVGWHGNYAPYKYDLKHFNTVNTVSFDHPDPSIFTVLTSQSDTIGVANIDFVIFPERWMVSEHSFRPPYYHRNIMSEFMGLIYGAYDAKETGFLPGGCSLHNCMSAHGPDTNAYIKATQAKLTPQYYGGTLAFMFESRHIWKPTPFALECTERQKNYLHCWQNLPINFHRV